MSKNCKEKAYQRKNRKKTKDNDMFTKLHPESNILCIGNPGSQMQTGNPVRKPPQRINKC